MTLAGQMAKRLYGKLDTELQEPQLLLSPSHAWFDYQLPKELKQAFWQRWTVAIDDVFAISPVVTRGACASELERVAFNWAQLAEQPMHTQCYGRMSFSEHSAEIHDFYYEEMAPWRKTT